MIFGNDIIIAQGKSIYCIGVMSKNGQPPSFQLRDRYDLKGDVACFHATPIEGGSYLTTVVFDGSLISEVIFGERSSRLQTQIRHSFNFRFKATQILPILMGKNGAYLVLDESHKIYIFKPNESRNKQLANRFYGSQSAIQVLGLEKQTLILTKDGFVADLKYISIADVVQDLIVKKEIYSAANLVAATGKGKSHLLRFQLMQGNYTQTHLLEDYLLQLTPEDAFKIITDQNVGSIESLLLLVNLVQDPVQKKRYQEKIQVFKQFVVYNDELECQKFLNLDFLASANCLLYSYGVRDVASFFLMSESSNFVQDIFELLPLEELNPRDFLPHMTNSTQLFAYVAQEYINFQQSENALTVLAEGLKNRQLLSRRLTRLALEAQKMSCEDWSIIEQFTETKWIYILDASLYQSYLHHLKEEVKKSLLLCNEHGDPDLIALHDGDLVQIIFEVVYSGTIKLNDPRVPKIKIEHLSCSDNQNRFRQVFQGHLRIAELQAKVGLPSTLSFYDLLQIMTDKESGVVKLTDICTQAVLNSVGLQQRTRDKIYAIASKPGSSMIESMKYLFKGASPVQQEEAQIGKEALKWAKIYQDLFEITSILGYQDPEKTVVGSRTGFNLDRILLDELFKSKSTLALRQLLEHAAEPQHSKVYLTSEELHIRILDFTRQLYGDMTVECAFNNNKFDFHVQLLEELQTFTDVDLLSVTNEIRLIETVTFLHERQLLAKMPLKQVRNDFFSSQIIKKILMMHGFKRYPDHFEIMHELAGMIGMSQSQLVGEILGHLDSIHFLDNIEIDCPFVPDLVFDKLLSQKDFPIEDCLAEQLYKIHLQSPDLLITDFLTRNIQNKESELAIQLAKDAKPDEIQQFFEEVNIDQDQAEQEDFKDCVDEVEQKVPWRELLAAQSNDEIHSLVTHYYSDSWENIDVQKLTRDFANTDLSCILSDYLADQLGAQDKEFARDLIEANIPYNILRDDVKPSHLPEFINLTHKDHQGRILYELDRLVSTQNLYLICYICENHGIDSSIPASIYYLQQLKHQNTPPLISQETLLTLIHPDTLSQLISK